MLQAILNGLKTTVLKPQSIFIAIFGILLQLVILFFSIDFLTVFLQNMVTGTGIPNATGLALLVGFIQTNPVGLAEMTLLVLAFLGIQMGTAIALAHLAGQLHQDNRAGVMTSIRFGLGQIGNIIFALLFFVMVGIIFIGILGIVMEIIGINQLAGMIVFFLLLLATFYLILKFFFTFAFWGVNESNLKEGLSASFSFVSQHLVQTIVLIVVFSLINSLIGTAFYALIQSWDDTATVAGAIILNAILTTFYGLTIGFYVASKKSGEKTAAEKPSRRAKKEKSSSK